MYQPGQSGNPAGRPKKSIDHKWSDISYWFGVIISDFKHLKPADKLDTAKWALEFLAKHTKQMDLSKGSQRSDVDVIKMLQELENAAEEKYRGNHGNSDGQAKTK